VLVRSNGGEAHLLVTVQLGNKAIDLPPEEAHLSITQPTIEHLQKPGDYALINGHFKVQKSNSGYVKSDIILVMPAPWLILETECLTNESFDENHEATIIYTIDPLRIKSYYARASIIIKSPDTEETIIDIIFKRQRPLRAWLPRQGYQYQDEGILVIENQADEPMQVKLFCNAPFVCFQQHQYKVEGQLKIPFIIKLSSLQSTKMLFRKIPFLSADIEIHAKYKGKIIKQTVSLTASDLQLSGTAEAVNTKKVLASALRQWLSYAVTDSPNFREYLYRANHAVLSALRNNGFNLQLYWLGIFFAIELDHFDKAKEMLDNAYTYRSYYKNKHPFYYKALHFLYAHLEIKQNRIKSAKKYMHVLDANRDPLMLGMLHLALALGEHEAAYRLLTLSYDEGCRSIFLFNALLTYYHAAADHQPSRQDLLIQVIHWAINHGIDPKPWMLKALCTHYMAASDYGAKAYSYYRDAERWQIHLPDLSHFLVRSAFKNGSTQIHHYTMTQYLQKPDEDAHLQIYVYHLLLTDPDLADLVNDHTHEILQMADYGLQNDIRSRFAHSLYHFLWKEKNESEGWERILEKIVISDNEPDDFKAQCNMALGQIYFYKGQLDRALEYYGKAGEHTLDNPILENMLTAYIQQKAWNMAAGLIERRGHQINGRVLFNAIKPLAMESQARWHPAIANTAYQLLLHSKYDKNLLDVVLANFIGTHDQWLTLSHALSVVSVQDQRLDEIILKSAAWAHRFDEETQRVFVHSVSDNSTDRKNRSVEYEKNLNNFIYYTIYEVIVNHIKPLTETIATLEQIYIEDKDDRLLLTYALCHVYLTHGISTARSDGIIEEAIRSQEENGIIFPIFKGSKKIKHTYIEKYRPFMYKTLPGKIVRLYYKVDEEADWRIKDMDYWRFGIYLARVPHFYNEVLTYYFSEELPTGSIATREEEIHNKDVYLDDGQTDPFFIINNATIYEQMFRYEQVEEIIGGLVKDVRAVRSRLM